VIISTHSGGLIRRNGPRRLSARRQSALTPAQALVESLLAYSPSLLLLADLGALQGDDSPADASDPLTAAVATWQDQSGHGHHATQATVMARPAITSMAIGDRAAMA
jgi:hypothetical protein